MALIGAGAAKLRLEDRPRGDRTDLEGRLHHPRAAARSSAQGLRAQPGLVNLLLDPAIGDDVESGAGRLAAHHQSNGGKRHPRAALTRRRWRYFDSYRTARLPQSLTQAQRDAFGAHTYERTDRPGGRAQRVVIEAPEGGDGENEAVSGLRSLRPLRRPPNDDTQPSRPSSSIRAMLTPNAVA